MKVVGVFGKMNDSRVGRKFNFLDIIKVVIWWWECEFVRVFWLVVMKL